MPLLRRRRRPPAERPGGGNFAPMVGGRRNATSITGHASREGIIKKKGRGRSFDQMLFCDLQGKFTTVQVDIQQLYVHCTKKVPEYRYPLYFEKFKNRADFAMLIHAD
jgi:hypothetical protein